MEKSPEAFRTISEVAHDLDLPQHVLRFWETRFNSIKPLKRGGGRRYYRPDDIDLLRGIRHLLYSEGYTIRGVQRILKEQGVKFVQVVWKAGSAQPSRDDVEPIVSVVDSEKAGPRLFGLIPSLLSGQSDPSRSERRGPLFDLLEGKKLASIVVDKAGDDDDDEEEIDDDDDDDSEDDDEDDVRDGEDEAVERRSKSTPPAVNAPPRIAALDQVKPGLERAVEPPRASDADTRQRLQTALDELKECQRQIELALRDTE